MTPEQEKWCLGTLEFWQEEAMRQRSAVAQLQKRIAELERERDEARAALQRIEAIADGTDRSPKVAEIWHIAYYALKGGA